MSKPEYAGFWIRTGAAIIDSVLVMLIIGPLLTMIYGGDYWLDPSVAQGPWPLLFNYIFPAIAITLFWIIYPTISIIKHTLSSNLKVLNS